MSVQDKLGNLKVEELERRIAPVVGMQKTTPDGSVDSGDTFGGGGTTESADQPGSSDGQRNKLFHENQ